jgi:2-polyprenyl-6-methoxyphenol hydroxylase-like FAD-dependent oxidoreductase
VNLNLSLEDIQPLSPSEQQDGAKFVLSFKNVVSGEELKARARHVVACDGIKSRVRSLLPKEPDILLAENKSVWRGLAPTVSTSGKATFYTGKSGGNTAGRTGLIFPGGKNVGSSWTVISDVEDQRSESEEESRRRVLKVVESMGKDSNNFKLFKQIIEESSVIIESKLHIRDFDKPWESAYDGLIYVGDSAHPVRPTGQGTALAVEDANVLGKVILKCGLCDKAFREYENERYEPIKNISEKIRNMAESFYTKEQQEEPAR